jgi:hypothetical protein
MHDFAENRASTLTADIKQFFALSDIKTLTLSSNTGKATYKFNGEPVLADNVELQYFANKNVSVEADKLSGYEFKYWVSKPTITIIPKNAEWSYWDKQGEPATDWAAFDYTSTAWKNGAAPLGYGNHGSSTTVVGKTDLIETMIGFGGNRNDKYPTSYYRKIIQIEDLDKKSAFVINAAVDDGAIIYVNGTEVYREAMYSGVVTYKHLSQGYSDSPFSFTVPKSLLREGKNVIAAEVHQSMGGDGSKTIDDIKNTGSDSYFHLELIYSDDDETKATVLSTNVEYEFILENNQGISAIYETGTPPKDIYINEVSGNEKWIEIYNAENEAVDLSGYILRKKDEVAIVTDWTVPAGTTIAAGGYLVWTQTTDFPYGISADKDVTFILIDDRKAELDVFEITSNLYSFGEQRTVGRKSDGCIYLKVFEAGGTKGATNGSGECALGIVTLPSPSQSLKVYPNPVNDILTIEAESPIKKVTISDLSGRSVISTDALRDVKVTVATAKLSKGVYLLTVETEQGKTAKKIVK